MQCACTLCEGDFEWSLFVHSLLQVPAGSNAELGLMLRSGRRLATWTCFKQFCMLQAVYHAPSCCGCLLQSMDQVTAARLYVAAFPWPVDTLAICSKIVQQGGSASTRGASSNYNFRQLLQQSTSLSPFRAIAYSPTPST